KAFTMRKKILIIIISVPLLVLLTSLSYTCFKNYCANVEAAELYKEGLKPIKSTNNQFDPQTALDYCDSLSRSPQPWSSLVNTLSMKSLLLLKLGREKEAAAMLIQILQTRGDKTDNISMSINKNLAIAYLRLGERNNCINNHSDASCILPIRGKGIYTDPSATQKGIEIYEQILQKDSTDLESRWLLNIASMTIGEYPSKVPSRWLIPGLDTDSSSHPVKAFQDMAGVLGLDGPRNLAGGVIVDDFNNDGYLDIITSTWGLDDCMHYFRNNADGTFTDIAETAGLSRIKGGLNIIQADYNNDGFTDILVLRGAWLGELGKQPNTLLRNNGNGTFTDVTIESGLLSFNPTQTGVWADFNNDGWLDLFIGNESREFEHPHPAELFINNQDGTFTNVAEASGVDFTNFMKGVASADYNNDGWPDIFICGSEYQKSLAASAGAEALKTPESLKGNMFLYRNNHDGTFTNVASKVGLNKSVYAMGANFGDIDNDGWLDMYLGTGNPDVRSLVPNKMFKNISGQQFADVTTSARVGNLQKGHGVSFADINNDGYQDIFIKVGGAVPGDTYFNSFYVNPGQNENNWIGVLLEGTKSNRSAIGAHIAVSFTEKAMKRTVYMDVNSGGSFGSNPLRKEIGIGEAKNIDELIIKWPTSGIVQVFKNIAPDQFIKITEGKNQIEKMNIKTLKYKAAQGFLNMISCSPVK
ncbi:MAG TPA: CRTAC1 family protein, partial [Puia sp.]|nr:CRTAC1 family protein [Puia sp.]